MANHPTTYYVGLDLGQSQDYTALAMIQKVPTYDPQTGKHSSELHLKHLERYPLKTPYTDIADQVKSLLTGDPFTTPVFLNGRVARPTTELIVDKTGVEVAVTDLLKERRLNYIAVTITGLGQKVNRTGTREYSVPKQDLVSALEVPFHKGTLKVARGSRGGQSLGRSSSTSGASRTRRPRTYPTSTGGSRIMTTWCWRLPWPAGRRPISARVALR